MEIRLPNFLVRLFQTKTFAALAMCAFFLFLPVLMLFGAGSAVLQNRRKRRLACTLMCPSCGIPLDRASVARADARWKETMRELLRKDSFSARYRVIRYLDAICGVCAAEITIEAERKSSEPPPPSVTPRAVARVAPAGGVAHL